MLHDPVLIFKGNLSLIDSNVFMYVLASTHEGLEVQFLKISLMVCANHLYSKPVDACNIMSIHLVTHE